MPLKIELLNFAGIGCFFHKGKWTWYISSLFRAFQNKLGVAYPVDDLLNKE